jgi:hypothetical protein
VGRTFGEPEVDPFSIRFDFAPVPESATLTLPGLVPPTSPFADLKRAPSVTWLEPRLVAEVTYSDLMEDRLRDPVLRELHVAR